MESIRALQYHELLCYRQFSTKIEFLKSLQYFDKKEKINKKILVASDAKGFVDVFYPDGSILFSTSEETQEKKAIIKDFSSIGSARLKDAEIISVYNSDEQHYFSCLVLLKKNNELVFLSMDYPSQSSTIKLNFTTKCIKYLSEINGLFLCQEKKIVLLFNCTYSKKEIKFISKPFSEEITANSPIISLSEKNTIYFLGDNSSIHKCSLGENRSVEFKTPQISTLKNFNFPDQISNLSSAEKFIDPNSKFNYFFLSSRQFLIFIKICKNDNNIIMQKEINLNGKINSIQIFPIAEEEAIEKLFLSVANENNKVDFLMIGERNKEEKFFRINTRLIFTHSATRLVLTTKSAVKSMGIICGDRGDSDLFLGMGNSILAKYKLIGEHQFQKKLFEFGTDIFKKIRNDLNEISKTIFELDAIFQYLSIDSRNSRRKLNIIEYLFWNLDSDNFQKLTEPKIFQYYNHLNVPTIENKLSSIFYQMLHGCSEYYAVYLSKYLSISNQMCTSSKKTKKNVNAILVFNKNIIEYINKYILDSWAKITHRRLVSRTMAIEDPLKALLLNGILFFKKASKFEQIQLLGDNWRIKRYRDRGNLQNGEYIFFTSYFDPKIVVLASGLFRLFRLKFTVNDKIVDLFSIKTFFFKDDFLIIFLEDGKYIKCDLSDLTNRIKNTNEVSRDAFKTNCKNDKKNYTNPILISENIYDLNINCNLELIKESTTSNKHFYSSTTIGENTLLGGRAGEIFIFDGITKSIFQLYQFGAERTYNPIWVLKNFDDSVLIATNTGQLKLFSTHQIAADVNDYNNSNAKKFLTITPDFITYENERILDALKIKNQDNDQIILSDQGGFVYCLERLKSGEWYESWSYHDTKPITGLVLINVGIPPKNNTLISASSLSGKLHFFSVNGIKKGSIKLDSPLYTFINIEDHRNFKPAEGKQVVTIIGPDHNGYIVAIDIVDQKYHFQIYTDHTKNQLAIAIQNELIKFYKYQNCKFPKEINSKNCFKKIASLDTNDPSAKEIIDSILEYWETTDPKNFISFFNNDSPAHKLSEYDQSIYNKHFPINVDENSAIKSIKVALYHAMLSITLRIRGTQAERHYLSYPYQKLQFDVETLTGFEDLITNLKKRINIGEFVKEESKTIGNLIRNLTKSLNRILLSEADRNDKAKTIELFLNICFAIINNWGPIGGKTNIHVKKELSKSIFKRIDVTSLFLLLSIKINSQKIQHFHNIINSLINDSAFQVSYKTFQNIEFFLKTRIQDGTQKEKDFLSKYILNIVCNSIIESNLLDRAKRWLLIQSLRIQLLIANQTNELSHIFFNLLNSLIVKQVPPATYRFIATWLNAKGVSNNESSLFYLAANIITESPGAINKFLEKIKDVGHLENIQSAQKICNDYVSIKGKPLFSKEIQKLLIINPDESRQTEFVENLGSNRYYQKSNDFSRHNDDSLLKRMDYKINPIPENKLSGIKEAMSLPEFFEIIDEYEHQGKALISKQIYLSQLNQNKPYKGFQILFAMQKTAEYLNKTLQKMYSGNSANILIILKLNLLKIALEQIEQEVDEYTPYQLQEAIGIQRIKVADQFFGCAQKSHGVLHFALKAHKSSSLIIDLKSGKFQINRFNELGLSSESDQLENPEYGDFGCMVDIFQEPFDNTIFGSELETIIHNIASSYYFIYKDNRPLQHIQSIIKEEYLLLTMQLENRPYGIFIFQFENKIATNSRNKYFRFSQLPNFILGNYLLNIEIDKVTRNFEAISANFGHNVRQPLSTIRQVCDSLLDRWDVTENTHKKRRIQGVQAKAFDMDQRLRRLIRTFATYKERVFLVEPVEFHLKEHVESVVRDIRKSFSGFGINILPPEFIDFEGYEDDRFIVYTDKHYLTDVLFNLLENAAKYSKRGSRVWFKIKFTAKHIAFEIIDEGIGIPSDKEDEIFQPFRRLTKSDYSDRHHKELIEGKKSGFGVGLFVCQYIMEEGFRSRIRYSPNSNKGSTFSFLISRSLSI